MIGFNKYLILLFLLLGSELAYSQPSSPRQERRMTIDKKNTEGTEFFLCFMKNYKDEEIRSSTNALQLELFITARDSANVKISIKDIMFNAEIAISPNTIKNVHINPKAQIVTEEIPENLAIHIISDSPITVYGLNRRFQTTDTYLGMPVNTLGKEYRVMCYTAYEGMVSEFAIIATEDSTLVKITPTTNTTVHPANIEYPVILNRGQTYLVWAAYQKLNTSDLTGSLIVADKPIAVFSGHTCASVPPKVIACNHLVEQMPPIDTWGRHFFIGKFLERTFYTYRVLANDSNTKVFEENKLVKVLNAGQFYENQTDRDVQITSDKPVLVAQYSQGFQNGDSIGDPMMIMVSPTQQFLKRYHFATPISGFWRHLVNVVVPTRTIKSIRLNKSPIDPAMFTPLGISRYSIARLFIPFGNHIIEADEPFGMYSYGFGEKKDAYDAYGTMGGQSFEKYLPIPDTLPPMAEDSQDPRKMRIVFRDDRIDDSGLKRISVVKAEGLKVIIPNNIDEGISQLEVDVVADNPEEAGRATIEAVDVAGNISTWSICYVFDNVLIRNVFFLYEGKIEECEQKPSYQFGIFGRIASSFHSPHFSNSGNVNSHGFFNEVNGYGGYAGLLLSRRFSARFAASARLSLENYSCFLTSPDTILSNYMDQNGNTKMFQEVTDMDFNAKYLNLSFTAEYYPVHYFYGLAGLSFSFNVGDDIQLSRRIVRPQHYAYVENGKRSIAIKGAPDSIGSLAGLRLGVFGGLGFTYKINFNISAFLETSYTNYFGNIINDGQWGVEELSFIFGLRYRL